MSSRTRLAVILHADIVDSTRLVQLDELLAHDLMQSMFRRFSDVITEHGGTTHEIRGDALVAEFKRASDAVTAAISFQRENEAAAAAADNAQQPRARVGIALGEVVIEDGTVTGTGVVLAQRLEQLGRAGAIVLQGAVRETVPNRLHIVFDSLGEQHLKGFAEPVRAYVVNPAIDAAEPEPGVRGADPPPEQPGHLVLPAKPSLAVMPFADLGAQDSDHFLADGLTEDLITTLSTISGLFVISRHSSQAYRDRTIGPRTVAAELGVRYLLEGTVRSAGNRLRVTAQLIDAQSGENVYAERFDRTVDSVFDLQDEITREIVTALRIQLTDGEQARLWWRYTEDLGSWSAAMHGWDLMHRGSSDTNRRARASLEKAIALDPNNALAMAWLSMVHYTDGRFGFSESAEESFETSERLAREALAIDPQCPHAPVALGLALSTKGQFEEAIAQGRISLEASPSDAWVKMCQARNLLFAGQAEQAEELMRQAIRLDPRYPNFYLGILGNALMDLHRDQEAEEVLSAAVERDPEYFAGHLRLAALLGLAGRREEARRQVSEVLRINPRFNTSHAEAFIGTGNPQALERFVRGIRAAGIP